MKEEKKKGSLLPAISIFMLCDAPETALPTMKIATLSNIVGFLPKMSAILPDSGRIAVLANEKADPIHT